MSPLEFLFGSHLVSAAVVASAALSAFPVMRREVRLRPDAWWTREDVMGIVIAPAITIALAFSVFLIALAFSGSAAVALTAQEIATMGGAGMLAVLAWILTGFGGRERAPLHRDDARGSSRESVMASG